MIDALTVLALIGLTVWAAAELDARVRIALAREPGRHRQADHPEESRAWLAQPRPAGALTPTRTDRRRVQNAAWRTYLKPYRAERQAWKEAAEAQEADAVGSVRVTR